MIYQLSVKLYVTIIQFVELPETGDNAVAPRQIKQHPIKWRHFLCQNVNYSKS